MKKRRSPSPPPLRSRLNSKDIPRTYSGLFGAGGELHHQTPNSDLLPFELSRNLNTAWLRNSSSVSSLLCIYIFIIAFIQFSVMTLPLNIPFEYTWTATHLIHGMLTLLFLHWIKGSPNFYEQGELNAMTLWEQISSSPDNDKNHAKNFLFIVPTVLCYIACHFGHYEKMISFFNAGMWFVCIVAKTETMNGVRVLGINRTIGIDDDTRVSPSKAKTR